MEASGRREQGGKAEEEKTVAIFGSRNTNMGRKKEMRGKGGADPMTVMQLVLVGEVVEV